MKFILATICILLSGITYAQKMNEKMFDKIKQKTILINTCSRDELVQFKEFKDEYDVIYTAYQPDQTIISALKNLIDNKKITIVLGTWCSDSKQYVPYFFKILDQISMDFKNVTLICVDGNKKAECGLIDKLNIQKVPTFIFSDQNNVELGRIIESPSTNLEADMQTILTKKNKPDISK